MYKLLFVVVLAAASFAGGAAVHSQGPRWAKELIQSQLGGDGADAPTVEETQSSGDPPIGGEIPSQPLPPLDIEPAPPTRPTRPAAVTRAPVATNGQLPHAPEPKAPEPLDPRALGLGDGPSGMKPPTPLAEAQAPALLPSPVPPADGPPVLEAPAGLIRPRDRGPAGQDARGGGSRQPVASPPMAPGNHASGDPAAPPPVPGDDATSPGLKPPAGWAELRHTMRALGVSRFVIEGEPGGRVRFHCLIPVAGSRAVAQHFEAEGDDEFHAAEVALRRVTLWRATEASGP